MKVITVTKYSSRFVVSAKERGVMRKSDEHWVDTAECAAARAVELGMTARSGYIIVACGGVKHLIEPSLLNG